MTATSRHFELVRTHAVPALNICVEEYFHPQTGAQHVHLASEHPENVFLVALRTVPQDSRGVAHILEHTALCGSKKYSVRDPFFMMTRRSLNTFMNAFTSSDWTAYPFASQNRKDFFNLLDVYMDAVFFPRLDPLDFAQEGHRLEFSQPDDPQSGLVIRGIVYNEMKGAMSSPTSRLWHKLSEQLFPTTTYHYNSGGDPLEIPDLTYQDLREFHRTHYHPSNAIFMTFGNLPVEEVQSRIASSIRLFEPLDYQISVPPEQRYTKPQSVESVYPAGPDDSQEARTHIVVGWLLGDSTDLNALMEAQLLSAVLLDNSASPLLHALETSSLGRAPSPLCGVDDSQREICFVCGLEGCDENAGDAVEQLILDTLSEVAENGVPQEEVEACLHQIELHQREISGDGMPYGLNLILSALNSATHRGNPAALLDLEPALARLRQANQDPDFIRNLARKWLLDNTHRVRLVMKPDAEFSDREARHEQQRLAAMEASLGPQDRTQIQQLAQALQQRQLQQDDPEILPKVSLSDVPASLPYPEKQSANLDGVPFINYGAGTNGLIYQQLLAELPQLDEDELVLLPLLTHLMTEVGAGELSYLEMQKWQSRVSGGLHASYLVRGMPEDVQQTRGYFSLSGKALSSHQQALSELMQATLEQVRFDEARRLRELVAQARLRSEAAITGSGHSLAMTAAAQQLAPAARLAHRAAGLAGIAALKAMDDSLEDRSQLDELIERLRRLHQKVIATQRHYLVIGEESLLESAGSNWRRLLEKPLTRDGSPFTLTPTESGRTQQMWITNTQVHFCARAYPTVPSAHPDAPALTVLAGFLRNNFLHRAIREQGGAYGGGASQDNNTGAFRFYSYRDPRLADTLQDFDTSLEWLQRENHQPRLLEEAILGVIAQIDKPGSPAGEARQACIGELFGRDRKSRDAFRQAVLKVSLEDLKRVAATYLRADRASTAVLTHNGSTGSAQELGLEVLRL